MLLEVILKAISKMVQRYQDDARMIESELTIVHACFDDRTTQMTTTKRVHAYTIIMKAGQCLIMPQPEEQPCVDASIEQDKAHLRIVSR